MATTKSALRVCIAVLLVLLAVHTVATKKINKKICKPLLGGINKGAQAALALALKNFDVKDFNINSGKFKWKFSNIKVEPLSEITSSMTLNDTESEIIWQLTEPSLTVKADWQLSFKLLWFDIKPKGSSSFALKASDVTTSISTDDTDQCSSQVEWNPKVNGVPWYLKQWFNKMLKDQLKNNQNTAFVEETMCTVMRGLVSACSLLGGK